MENGHENEGRTESEIALSPQDAIERLRLQKEAVRRREETRAREVEEAARRQNSVSGLLEERADLLPDLEQVAEEKAKLDAYGQGRSRERYTEQMEKLSQRRDLLQSELESVQSELQACEETLAQLKGEAEGLSAEDIPAEVAGVMQQYEQRVGQARADEGRIVSELATLESQLNRSNPHERYNELEASLNQKDNRVAEIESNATVIESLHNEAEAEHSFRTRVESAIFSAIEGNYHRQNNRLSPESKELLSPMIQKFLSEELDARRVKLNERISDPAQRERETLRLISEMEQRVINGINTHRYEEVRQGNRQYGIPADNADVWLGFAMKDMFGGMGSGGVGSGWLEQAESPRGATEYRDGVQRQRIRDRIVQKHQGAFNLMNAYAAGLPQPLRNKWLPFNTTDRIEQFSIESGLFIDPYGRILPRTGNPGEVEAVKADFEARKAEAAEIAERYIDGKRQELNQARTQEQVWAGIEAQADALEAVKTQMQSLQSEIDEAQGKINTLTQDRDATQEQLRSLSFLSFRERGRLQSEIATCDSRLASLSMSLEGMNAQRVMLESEQKQFSGDIPDKSKAISSREQWARQAQALQEELHRLTPTESR